MTTVPSGQRTPLHTKRGTARTALDTNRSVYRAIESGRLAALKLGTGTGTYRVLGAAVLAYEKACARAACDRSGAVGSRPLVVG